MVVKILLDTNFLLDIIRFRVDISNLNLSENGEICISKATLNEIKSMANLKRKEGRLALVALKLIESENIKVVESLSDKVDEDLLLLAKKYDFIVATNDKDLRKKLKMNNIKTICLKNKKKIEVIE